MKRKEFLPVLTPFQKVKRVAIEIGVIGILFIPVYTVASVCVMPFKTEPWGIGNWKPLHYSIVFVPDAIHRKKMEALQFSDKPDKEYTKEELAVGREERLSDQRKRMAFNR
jgi:hypothetical protein